MKKYAVLYNSDPLGTGDKPRELVGESDSIHGAKVIQGKYIKEDPYEYRHCIIVDTYSDDGNWVYVMNKNGDRSTVQVSLCSVINAYRVAGKLMEEDFH